MPSLITWIVVPLLGGAIGYLTNRLAVKMLFRPIRPMNFLGLRIQGLLGRRQQALAESIGRVVGDHLVEHQDIVKSLGKVDLEGLLSSAIASSLRPKIEEWRSFPLVGGLLTDERVESIRDAMVAGVLRHEAEIFEALESAIESGLDIREMVTEKVRAFPVEKLEPLVLEVASRELRMIEWFGGLLGMIIGIGQVLLIWALA